jgi:hypothetical protein
MAETQDEIAARLEKVAIELICRVRDYPADDNARWVVGQVDAVDLVRLTLILAAAVPVDMPWRHLTAWVSLPAKVTQLSPCGTRAAYLRHKAHGQAPDEACTAAYREYERARIRRRRAAA